MTWTAIDYTKAGKCNSHLLMVCAVGGEIMVLMFLDTYFNNSINQILKRI